MQNVMTADIPSGYRLLVQLVEAKSRDEAEATVERMFKGRIRNAVYRPGTMQPMDSRSLTNWRAVDAGWSVFVPYRKGA